MTSADRIKKLRETLEEIRDIAQVSEGVEFYAMLASNALKSDDVFVGLQSGDFSTDSE